MNTARKLLAEVTAAGCRAWADGKLIQLRGPRPLPAEIMDRLRDHKVELLKMLADSAAASPPDTGRQALETAGDPPPLTTDDRADVAEAIQERAAVQEYDGGLPRPEAERQARAAMRVYAYRLTDDPGQWLVMIAPGCELAEAECSIRRQFGAKRVLEVRPHRSTP